MMKMDNGTGSGSKIFQLNDEDIELIVRLLHEERDHHVYYQDSLRKLDQEYFKKRYDHIQDLIMELTK
jgi:hypothetical protein